MENWYPLLGKSATPFLCIALIQAFFVGVLNLVKSPDDLRYLTDTLKVALLVSFFLLYFSVLQVVFFLVIACGHLSDYVFVSSFGSGILLCDCMLFLWSRSRLAIRLPSYL